MTTAASFGGDTVEAWALDYLRSTDLQTKLAPGSMPSQWAVNPAALRLEAPGRPVELVASRGKIKSPRPGALVHPARRAEILHRFLHHELQAAELLAWAILAFADTPAAFRQGLASILREELTHVGLYRAHLEHLGFGFGALPINDWFWMRVPSARTAADFVAVFGVGLEGGNLDHGLRFEAHFRAAGDPAAAALQARVVADEVGHVAFAAHWLAVLGGGADFETWRAHLPAPLSPTMMRGDPLNLPARRAAGLDDAFLDALSRWPR